MLQLHCHDTRKIPNTYNGKILIEFYAITDGFAAKRLEKEAERTKLHA